MPADLKTRQREALPDELFEPGGAFYDRGVSPEVARHQDAFLRYERGDILAILDFDKTIAQRGRGAIQSMNGRSLRAPGVMLRRFAISEGDPVITSEMRPDWAIWTGKVPKPHVHRNKQKAARDVHIHRGLDAEAGVYEDKTTMEMIVKGTTEEDRAILAKFGNMSADHQGVPDERRHFHPAVKKYLFTAQPRKTVDQPGSPHRHDRWLDELQKAWDEEEKHPKGRSLPRRRLKRHIEYEHSQFQSTKDPSEAHDPVVRRILEAVPGGRGVMTWLKYVPDDEEHHHKIVVKDGEIALAQRLSSHPMGFQRIAGASRVMFALEGCLKEASLVTAGEATFSCPSVSLWNAPELEAFAVTHLRGKRVFVICDSDWDRLADDSVIRMGLFARDRLISFGVEAYLAAPDHSEARSCAEHKRKHGVDDFLGPLHRGKVDDLIIVDREVPGLGGTYGPWVREHNPSRGFYAKGIERDEIVLRWLSLHASRDGVTRVALKTAARYLQDDLGRKTLKAAEEAVKRAIDHLEEDGAIEVVDIDERVREWLTAEDQEWVGYIKVLPPWVAQTAIRHTVGDLS